MDIHLDPLIKYFKGMLRYEAFSPDSSSVTEFKQCARRYFYRYVLGYKPREDEPYFKWGSTIHKFFECLEVYYARGKSVEECFALAYRDTMIFWGDTPDVQIESQWSFITKARLSKTLQVIAEDWKREKARGTIKVIATEQPFNVTFPNGVRRSGRFDQMIQTNRRLWGRDIKSTSQEKTYFKRQLYPNDQFATYTVAQSILNGLDVANGQFLAGQYVAVVFNNLGTKKEPEKGGPALYTEIVSFTPSALSKWLEEAKYWDNQMKYARENDIYPMNEKQCTFCKYRKVCSSSSDMSMMMTLKSEYKHEVWDNTKTD